MSDKTTSQPDYIFEVSWEVCNKVGGIHTVLSTKAQTLVEDYHERLIMIGPDVWKGTGGNPEFIEDVNLFKLWKQHTDSEGFKIKIGRWNVPGKPIAVLIDFTPFYQYKNEIFKDLWIAYQLDSLTGNWDYIEPAIFGYAAGKLIECFYRYHINSNEKVIAQFHEWMTGGGILYLEAYAPQIATVFTTHATVLGRSIAGNGLPFYQDFKKYDADEVAKSFNVISKHSLEKVAANYADCFTTVSEIMIPECEKFLNKQPDVITHNGFDNSIVPSQPIFEKKRAQARKKILDVASALFNQKLPTDSLLVIKSGRYEFKNKGIDIFIDSLAEINGHMAPEKTVVAVIFVPGHHTGPRKELRERMVQTDYAAFKSGEVLTHYLQGIDTDAIMNSIKESGLNNSPTDKVKVIFVPTYVNGDDGIFNMPYYDLLIGFDLAVFPSYYEPWGYTPLESLAFHIPAITTSISGFGKVIKTLFSNNHRGIYVVERNDTNRSEVVKSVAGVIEGYTKKSVAEIQELREGAHTISQTFVWEKQIVQYQQAYREALEHSLKRESLYREKPQAEPLFVVETIETTPQWRHFVVQSELPETLSPLKELSMNLWCTWDEDALALFESIGMDLWQQCHLNPIVFVQSLTYPLVKQLEEDTAFLQQLNKVAIKFKTYMAQELTKPLVAYFSMEYGLHNCLKLYSGGLGILAGDYLKEASDTGVNIVGIGLLYKFGYFKQNLTIHGEQLAEPDLLDFNLLPLQQVKDKNGKHLSISVAFQGRIVYALAWKVNVGRVTLYLLDTAVPENKPEDQSITAQLYNGVEENRLKQEIMLGIGGIQLLDALNIHPDIYHCNEGHAAFLGFGRLYDIILNENIAYEEALEIVRSSTLFTTHTPVPAGVDMFAEELLRPYLSHFAHHYNISWDALMQLGKATASREEKFSMAYLACNFAQEINAVSRIHKRVSCRLFDALWKHYLPEELHIGYITNGIHYNTWVAKEWKDLYEHTFGTSFNQTVANVAAWQKIEEVPHKTIWEIRKKLKVKLLNSIKGRMVQTLTARHESPRKIKEATDGFNERALVICFAKRMVVYKRPGLIFSDLERLERIINNSRMPVLLLFAGKAHPNDKASQELIKQIIDIAEKPELKHKVIFLEDYDMNLGKLLIQGVDLWLNTPQREMEASGTSGMKAMMNGVLNFSVMDGWWAEAYTPGMGWALDEQRAYENPDYQNELDAETIYMTLENEILPMFFERNEQDMPIAWIETIKKSIATSGQYTMQRTIKEYRDQLYNKLHQRNLQLCADNFLEAKALAKWKKGVLRYWKDIELISIETPNCVLQPIIPTGENEIKIVLAIGRLGINDVGLEVLISTKNHKTDIESPLMAYEFKAVKIEEDRVTFACKVPSLQPGGYDYSFRVFPKNPLLPHRQDFDLVKWL